jgi:hypothetical protein
MPTGTKYYSQVQMNVPATEANHLPTLGQVEKYVVDYVAGKVKNNVEVVSVANIPGTFDITTKNGDGDFTGDNVTTEELTTIDEYTLEVDDRILLAGQTNKWENGIYTVKEIDTVTTLVRASDFNNINDIVFNVRIPVKKGFEFHDTIFALTNDDEADFTFVTDGSFEFAQSAGKGGGGPVEVRGYFEEITGDDVTKLFTITHNLGTKNVIPNIVATATGQIGYVETIIVDENNITVDFGNNVPQDVKYTVNLVGYVPAE